MIVGKDGNLTPSQRTLENVEAANEREIAGAEEAAAQASSERDLAEYKLNQAKAKGDPRDIKAAEAKFLQANRKLAELMNNLSQAQADVQDSLKSAQKSQH